MTVSIGSTSNICQASATSVRWHHHPCIPRSVSRPIRPAGRPARGVCNREDRCGVCACTRSSGSRVRSFRTQLEATSVRTRTRYLSKARCCVTLLKRFAHDFVIEGRFSCFRSVGNDAGTKWFPLSCSLFTHASVYEGHSFQLDHAPLWERRSMIGVNQQTGTTRYIQNTNVTRTRNAVSLFTCTISLKKSQEVCRLAPSTSAQFSCCFIFRSAIC